MGTDGTNDNEESSQEGPNDTVGRSDEARTSSAKFTLHRIGPASRRFSRPMRSRMLVHPGPGANRSTRSG